MQTAVLTVNLTMTLKSGAALTCVYACVVDYTTCFPGDCDGQSADFLTTATLHWDSSSNITLTNVTVQHTGGYGVWFGPGVVGALLSRALVTDMGAGAVRIGAGMSGTVPQSEVAVGVVVQDSVCSR